MGPLPRGWRWVVGVLLLSAALLLLPHALRPGTIPGTTPDAAVTVNLHWQVQTHGLSSYIADDLHSFPRRTDRLVQDGLPLDAWASAPLCAVLGLPLGMWAYTLLLLWALGVSAAWLGGRWWGNSSAALVCGVAYQSAEALLVALGEGRSTVVFGAVFLPLTLGYSVLAARTGQLGAAVAAGVTAALASLAGWTWALPALALALAPQLVRRRGATTLASFSVLLVFPLAWVISGRGEVPSLSMDPWSSISLGLEEVRPVDLAAARVFGLDGVLLRSLLRPLLWAAVALTLLRQPLRVTWLPATLGLVFVILGLGPYLPGPLVLPFGLLMDLPGFSRFWYPDRWWALLSLGAAVLAAGVAHPRLPQRLVPLLAPLLLCEAFFTSAALPFSALPLPPADTARVLAERPEVPFLLLPVPGGQYRVDRLDLLDQTAHGRPMANGVRSPFDLTAPDPLLRQWQSNRGLAALTACEQGQTPSAPEGVTSDLIHDGIRMIYLDTRYLDREGAYRRCVESVLTGWTQEQEQAPFLRYQAPMDNL